MLVVPIYLTALLQTNIDSMGEVGYGVAGGKAFLLTAVVKKAMVEEVVKAMKAEGGFRLIWKTKTKLKKLKKK